MIKRLSVIIALGIALSLSACGNTDKAVNEPTEAEKVTEAIESTKYSRGNRGARNSHRGGGGATCNLCR